VIRYIEPAAASLRRRCTLTSTEDVTLSLGGELTTGRSRSTENGLFTKLINDAGILRTERYCTVNVALALDGALFAPDVAVAVTVYWPRHASVAIGYETVTWIDCPGFNASLL